MISHGDDETKTTAEQTRTNNSMHYQKRAGQIGVQHYSKQRSVFVCANLQFTFKLDVASTQDNEIIPTEDISCVLLIRNHTATY